MTQKISRYRVLLWSFLILAALAALPLPSPRLPAQPLELSGDSYTFREAYSHLLRSFIHPLQSKILIHGAIRGMDKALTHQKISHTIPSYSLSGDQEENLTTFYHVFQAVTKEVSGKTEKEKLLTDALSGMFEATEDPYTVYLTPHEFRSLTEAMNGGNFGGVGIYIELEKATKRLMILELIEGTPGAKAGLKTGDYIAKINGKPTKGIDLDVAQQQIRGPVGSTVNLTIERKNVPGERDYRITRALIHVKSLDYKLWKENIGYIHLRNFGEFTGRELERALEQLERKGARAYILDLRQNGGGYLDAADAVCSKFLPRGATVVSVQDRYGHQEKEFADGSEHPDYPMVVLVNEYTASASEITAGALQDYKRATLVGTRTFGKGSVQTIVRLRNGGAAKITIAYYLTPLGREINKKGVVPDVIVDKKGTTLGNEEDTQLKKATAILENQLEGLNRHGNSSPI